MNEQLPPFPVDDITLELVAHSLQGKVDPDGTHRLVDADMNLQQLLEFLSGYDPARLEPYEDESLHTHDDIMVYDGQIYSTYDVIESLIAEIRRLRG